MFSKNIILFLFINLSSTYILDLLLAISSTSSTSNIEANSFNVSKLGTVTSCSHLEIVCLETCNFEAKSSCVRLFSILNFFIFYSIIFITSFNASSISSKLQLYLSIPLKTSLSIVSLHKFLSSDSM